MITYILFFIGFAALIKGADLLVDGASSLAGRLGVSALVIGLTVVSFGTSAPELVVNLLASIEGNTEIAIGNILGSNIVNILLILGISAVFCPLAVKKGTVWKEIPFAFLSIVVLAFMANDVLIDGASTSILSRIDGLVLMAFFIIFLYYIFGIAKKESANNDDESLAVAPQYTTTRSLIMIIGGVVGLVLGGKWIVQGAVTFAASFGVSEALIGLTIVAIGTSLPEMATSIVAAYKKNVDIAVGNIVGSNIFNVLWILGISATIRPLPFSEALIFDLLVTVGATALLFLALFVGKRNTIETWQGIVLIIIYIFYLVYLVLRG